MSYDFPSPATENQEYTPAGGPTYVYKSPRWVVIDEAIHEAPVDGKQYAREDAAWSEVIIPATDWASIPGKPATFPPTVPIPWTDVSGKPATFPPTLPIDWTAGITGKPATYPPTVPIAWTDVSGKPSTYPPTVPIAWTDVSGKPATFPPTVPIPWTDVSGKPATFPPTLPITEADVTGLVADLALKAPLSSPALGGNPTAPTPSPGDNDTSIATTAFVTAAVTPKLDASVYTAADVLTKIKTVDGTGSGLDADLLDGQTGAYYSEWLNITNKPTTFPPAVPIAQADITNLTTDLTNRVLKAGDTMTGDLTINKVNPEFTIQKTTSNEDSGISFKNATAMRFRMRVSGTLDDFGITRYDNAGALLDSPFSIERSTGHIYAQKPLVLNYGAPTAASHATSKFYVDTADGLKVTKTGDIMTGTLSIQTAAPAINLQKDASGQSVTIAGYTGASMRWWMMLGNGAAESGSDAGSNFSLTCFNDAGSQIVTALSITRSTGLATVAGDPTAALGIATKQYVDAKPSATIADAAPSSPVNGQLWWNSANGNLYIFYNDGTSTQWVQINTVGS